jgi:excisionase family DNA binding protein
MMDVERTAGTTDPGSSSHIGKTITLDHAAELLGVSKRTVYNRIKDGYLLTVRIHQTQRVRVDSLSLYMQRERAERLGLVQVKPKPQFS